MSYLQLLRDLMPEAVVAATVLAVLGLGLAKGWPRRLCPAVAILGILCACGAILAAPANPLRAHGMLALDGFSCSIQLICLTLALPVVLMAAGDPTPHRGENMAMILLATLGMMTVAGTGDLLMVFIGLELLGLSLYVLAAFDKTSARSAEAGLKYFLYGSAAAAFLLFGISLVYGMCGTTGMAEVLDSVRARGVPPLLAAGFVMVLAGLGFKIAAAPFHVWAPDVYEAAPASSAALIGSASKVASFAAIVKITGLAFGLGAGGPHFVGMMIALLALASIVVGNVAALAQKSLPRLLGYSAVAHAGYTLLGVAAGTPGGFRATNFYIMVYAVTLVGAFGIVAALRRCGIGGDIADLAGLRSRSPLLAACLSVLMLTLAGLPPLPGFFGKFYLFMALMEPGHPASLLWLLAVALGGSLVSLYYYLMVLKSALVDDGGGERVRVGVTDRVLILSTSALVLALGLLPGVFLQYVLGSFGN